MVSEVRLYILIIILTYLLRSEEHTSELQSRLHLVCRLLLEKEKKLNLTLLNVLDQHHAEAQRLQHVTRCEPHAAGHPRAARRTHPPRSPASVADPVASSYIC